MANNSKSGYKSGDIEEALGKTVDIYKTQASKLDPSLNEQNHGEFLRMFFTKGKEFKEDDFRKYSSKENREKIKQIAQISNPIPTHFEPFEKGSPGVLNVAIIDYIIKYLLKKRAINLLFNILLYLKKQEVLRLIDDIEIGKANKEELETKLNEYDFIIREIIPKLNRFNELNFGLLFPTIP